MLGAKGIDPNIVQQLLAMSPLRDLEYSTCWDGRSGAYHQLTAAVLASHVDQPKGCVGETQRPGLV